jgi:hypothetical protein
VTGRLLSCGFGETGQLGRGDMESESFLDDVEGLGPVAMASCGHWHSAAVTRSGDLFTWGSNKHGINPNPDPNPLNSLNPTPHPQP